jgi:hypothetical protein
MRLSDVIVITELSSNDELTICDGKKEKEKKEK